MRRVPLLVALVAVALLGLVIVAQPTPRALAQEGTPTGEEFAPPEGVSFEPLGVAPGVAVSSPSDLVLIRFGLEPGAVLPSDPGDPSVALLVVEAGAITIEVDGPVTVTRSGAFGTAVATAEAGGAFGVATETVPAGEAVTLQMGDAAVIPANLSGELRNEGQESASGLAAIVAPPAEGTEGTPTS